jgi:hypothetical protein
MLKLSMQLLANPHIFSNLILSFTGVFIFMRYFRSQPVNNRWLWGIFLVSISVSALADLLLVARMEKLEDLRRILDAGEMTLGAVCLVVASWCLIMKTEASKMLFIGTLGFGGTLFYCVTWFKVEYVSLIVKAFCIVVTLLICCLGLGNRQKSALWVIFSMMFFALATKSKAIPIPMHPVDISHYLMVLAILCIGRAIRDEYKILF